MKLCKQSILALLLIAALLLGVSPAAMAADKGILYQGRQTSGLLRWLYQNDADETTAYTDTDLFANLKGVMPGDQLQQDFIIKNNSGNNITLYAAVVAHDAANPLSKEVAAQTTTSSAMAFLNQLEMKITAGEGDRAVTLFEVPQGQLGAFAGEKMLGVLQAQQGTVLHVSLKVPIDLDNSFMYLLEDAAAGKANGIGEVDLQFKIWENGGGGGGGSSDNPTRPSDSSSSSEPDVAIDDPQVPTTAPDVPEDADHPIVIPGEPVELIADPEIPLGDAPKTGDTSPIAHFVVLFVAAGIGLAITRKQCK